MECGGLGPGESVRQRGVQLVRTEAGQKKAGQARRAGGRCGRALGWVLWCLRGFGVLWALRALGALGGLSRGSACLGFAYIER